MTFNPKNTSESPSLANNARLDRAPRTERSRMLKAARRYLKLGLKVVPIEAPQAGNPDTGKKPLGGRSYTDATDDFSVFKRMVKHHEHFGIGIVTGDRVVVIDVDDGGRERLKELEAELGKLPECPIAETGSGGLHLYFQAPKDGLRTHHDKGGLDFKGSGGHVVACPSPHHSGGRYMWLRGRSPDELKIPRLPKVWEKAWRRGFRPVDQKAETKASIGTVEEGGRNNYLTEVAGTLIQKGLSGSQLQKALLRVNADKCNPPLNPAEVKKIARSIESKSSTADIDPVVRAKRETLDRNFAGGKHLMRLQDGNFWQFADGHWKILPILQLEKLIGEASVAIPFKTKETALRSDVVKLLEAEQFRDDDPLAFNRTPPRIINFRNGELHLRADGAHRLKPHSPKSGLRHKLPFDYEPGAECPLFTKTLKEIFRDTHNPLQLTRLIEEVFGYVVSQDRSRDVFFIFHGDGSNGKSLLMEILVALLGQDLVHFAPVESLDQRFAFAGLMGKLAFIDDDVRANIKLSDGNLKKLTGEKPLSVDVKYGPTMTFTSRVVVFMLTNNLPSLNDVSNGIVRRMKVVYFNRTFTAEEQDRTLAKRIIANELPGIMNRALKGWDRLQANGQFTEGRDVREAGETMLRQAHPVMTFLDQACVREPGAQVSMKDFYAHYRAWSAEQGMHELDQKRFSQGLAHAKVVSVRHKSGMILKGIRTAREA